MTPRTVLITGCSTGIGRACAERLASARTVEQLEQLLPAAGLELTAEELDRLSATTR